MSRTVLIALALLAAVQVAPSPARQQADPPGKKSLADRLAAEWEPKKVRVGDADANGDAAPKVGPNTVVVSSFTTTEATFEELWNYYAEKCGTDRRYKEKELHVASGEGKNGSFIIVDRVPEQKVRDTAFTLRTKAATVSVTLRPAEVGKAVLGIVIVVAH